MSDELNIPTTEGETMGYLPMMQPYQTAPAHDQGVGVLQSKVRGRNLEPRRAHHPPLAFWRNRHPADRREVPVSYSPGDLSVSTSPELKACPFCGEIPRVTVAPTMKPHGANGFEVECVKCQIGFTVRVIRESMEWAREKVVERWNRRASLSERDAATIDWKAKLQAESEVEGLAWVIVDSRPQDDGMPLYWCGFHWDRDHLRAVRFVRKGDAESAIMGLPNGMHLIGMSQQHQWGFLGAGDAPPRDTEAL